MLTDQIIAHQSAKQLIDEMYNNNYNTQLIAKLSQLSTTTIKRLYNDKQQSITPKTFHRLLAAYCQAKLNPSPAW